MRITWNDLDWLGAQIAVTYPTPWLGFIVVRLQADPLGIGNMLHIRHRIPKLAEIENSLPPVDWRNARDLRTVRRARDPNVVPTKLLHIIKTISVGEKTSARNGKIVRECASPMSVFSFFVRFVVFTSIHSFRFVRSITNIYVDYLIAIYSLANQTRTYHCTTMRITESHQQQYKILCIHLCVCAFVFFSVIVRRAIARLAVCLRLRAKKC